jgi:hypothetical protein
MASLNASMRSRVTSSSGFSRKRGSSVGRDRGRDLQGRRHPSRAIVRAEFTPMEPGPGEPATVKLYRNDKLTG